MISKKLGTSIAILAMLNLIGCGVLPNPTPSAPPSPPSAESTPGRAPDTLAATPLEVPGPEFIGLDLLGSRSKYTNIPALLKTLKGNERPIPTGAIWDNSFGGSDTNLTALFSSGGTNEHRAHLLNGTCITNRVCTSLDLLRGYTWAQVNAEAVRSGSRLRNIVCSQARRLQVFMGRYPQIKWLANGLLEHHMTRDAATQVAGQIAACAPGVQLVDNPGGGTDYAPIPGTLRESHGTVAAQVCSPDGTSVEDMDVETYKAECNAVEGHEVTLLWGRCDNCRTENPTFIPPDKRTACCTADQYAWHNQLRFPAQAKPTNSPAAFCRHWAEVTDPSIYKTSAEDKGTPDVRKNKPLLISKSTGNWDALATNGSRIGCLKFYGSFGNPRDRLWRAYSGNCDGKSAMDLRAAALKASGSEWGYLRNGVRDCFLVNWIRRSGSFHD